MITIDHLFSLHGGSAGLDAPSPCAEVTVTESAPSLSVVIPCYNHAAVLLEALASIDAQRWDDLEVIVVDDGSTDNTLAVLSRLADKKTRVISQANAGPAAARNRGIAEARGEWIAFLDADDRWAVGKLDLQMEIIRQRPSAGFCYADFCFQCLDGKERAWRSNPQQLPPLLELLLGNAFATPTLMVRRTCLERAGLFDVDMRTGEDWDLWLRLSANCEGAYVPTPLAFIRVAGAPGKYSLEMVEAATFRALTRLFNDATTTQRWPVLSVLRSKIYSWHCCVLAKSYGRQRRWCDSLRLVWKAVTSHPVALRFLTARGERAMQLARWQVANAYAKSDERHREQPGACACCESHRS